MGTDIHQRVSRDVLQLYVKLEASWKMYGQLTDRLRVLLGLRTALPAWAVMDSNHMARFIKARQCHVEDFRDLRAVLQGVLAALQTVEIRPIAMQILEAVSLETRMSFQAETLEAGCR